MTPRRTTPLITSRAWSANGKTGDLFVEWRWIDNSVRCVSIELRSDGESLNLGDLRASLGDLFEEARLQAANHFMGTRDRSDSAPPTNTGLARLRGAQRYIDAGRPNRLNDDHYRFIARDYRLLLRLTDAPTKHLAEQYEVSYPTAARWVHEARDRNLLPPTTPGRAAAEDNREED